MTPPLLGKRYLGDSVYAEVAHGMIKLTTENGWKVTNTIYLEPQVMQALQAYDDEMVWEQQGADHPPDCFCDECTCGGCGNRRHKGRCR